MTKFKKILAVVLAATLVLTLSACSSKAPSESEKLSVICTIFPEYDWVKNILGDKASEVDLTLLLDSGVDLHNYQPTVEDLAKISTCDMFVYVGGESDEWVEDALRTAANKDMVVVNLLQTLGDTVKEEEVKEGMEAEEEEEEGEEEEVEYDEHVWLSVKNAVTLCTALSEKLQTLDTENADTYKQNTENYVVQLNDLDTQFQSVCDSAKVKTLLFGDRFPFRYLVDDYGLDYFAAFVGCSAETEASFETVKFLASKVDELGLKSVMTIEGTDHKIADTVVKNTKNKNQQVLTLDSLQSVTSKDAESGVTYLSVMKGNLDVLTKALA